MWGEPFIGNHGQQAPGTHTTSGFTSSSRPTPSGACLPDPIQTLNLKWTTSPSRIT